MIKTFRYKIYPTKKQAGLLNNHFGCCRFIYNLALETEICNYENNKINLSAYDLIRKITEWKKDYTWLSIVSTNALQQSIIDLEKAYNNFFRQTNKFPKFKNKNSKQSFRIPSQIKINYKNNKLYIPKFRDGINIVFDRAPTGKIKSCTMSKTKTNKYFASILVEDGLTPPSKPIVDINNSLGVDLGLNHFAILSDGTKIDNPQYLQNGIKRIKILQQRASRKINGSRNKKKANLAIARKHEKIANRRKDFIHKLTHQLVCENQATTICIENLAVSNLIKNHKLAQAIFDVSWSKFIEILSYKCDWYGKNLIKIDRYFPSSKMCSECGRINQNLKLSDREWACPNCGAIHDRDINAAINIRNAGAGCSGELVEVSSVDEPMKQERVIIFNK